MSMQSLFYDFGDLGQPFRAFDLLTREMNRRFDRPEPRRTARPAFPEFEAWEKDEAFFLTAALPGVAREDLSVTVEKNTVTVSAKRELPALPGFELRARERRAFSFDRSFELPTAIAADKAEATLENGILTVTLPKAPEKKPIKVEIKTA